MGVPEVLSLERSCNSSLWFADFLIVRELLGLGMAAGMGANHCLSQGVTTHLRLP